MIITKIAIRDYRTCIDTTFEPHPQLSVLIGPNGSGKTNLLHAIALLKQLTGDRPRPYSPDQESTASSRITVHFLARRTELRFIADIKAYTDDDNHDVVVTARQRWYVPKLMGRKSIEVPLFILRSPASVRHYYEFSRSGRMYGGRLGAFDGLSKEIRHAMQIAEQFLSNMQYYAASQFTNPSSCPVSFEVSEKSVPLRQRVTAHLKFLTDMYAMYKRTNSPEYAQFLELIGARGLRLADSVEFKEIETSAINYSVQPGGRTSERKRITRLVIPQLAVGGQTLSFNQLSEGTFRTLALVFYLTTQSSTLLLLEEPEVSIHHGLLDSVMQIIKTHTRDKQIILSSHSELVLDDVSPANVFSVSFDRARGTRVANIAKRMSRRQMQALRDYLSTEGNLGEYWRSGGFDSD